jgi:hypothetical protein
MKFKSLALILITVLLAQNSWGSNRPHFFTALSVGAKRTSNLDVHAYIEATRIKTDVKIKLFKLAGRDWDKYQKIVDAQLKSSFDDALKELAYAQLLEHDATKIIGGEKERQSFLTTEKEYFEELQKRETEAVKEYLDQRLGIVEGRKLFGKELIEDGYPHRVDESAEDVYWRWYEDQKQIVKEEFRKREVLRHEYVEATRYNKKLRIRPTALFDLKKELDSIIDNKLHGRRLTLQQIREILSSHTALNDRIAEINLISMEELALSNIKKLDDQEFERYLAKIRRTLPELRKRSFLDRLRRYEQVSATLAKKYSNTEKLQELSEGSLDKFVEGGTYNNFMMARLYSMASKRLEKEVNADKNLQTLIQSIEDALPELLKRLSSADTYEKEQNKSLLFENVVANELRDIIGTTNQEGHLKELTDMAIWVVKFEAKKIAIEETPKVIVEKTSFDTFQAQEKLNQYLKKQAYTKGLSDYHQNRLVMMSYLLELKTSEGRRLSNDWAYNFILGMR